MTRYLLPLLAAGLLCAQSAEAQNGRIELNGFGRYTSFTRDRPIDDALGIGGGIGFYVTDRFRVAVDASFTSAGVTGNSAAPNVKYTPIHARLVYEQPIGSALRAMIGSGYVHNSYKNSRANDEGIGSMAGLKVRLSQPLSLFAQVTHDWMPPGWNTADPLYVVTPTGTVISFGPYADVNMGVEAGLALRLGGKAAPAPVAITEPVRPSQQTPEPQPVQPPPPPPPPQPAQPQPTATPKPPAYVTLVPVYFDYDKADIRPDARETLLAAVDVLNKNGSAEISIVGNADERGSDAYNLRLGRQRAENVKAFLVEHGIADSRLTILSNGEKQPVDPGHDEDAWAKNRRVEFKVKGDAPLIKP